MSGNNRFVDHTRRVVGRYGAVSLDKPDQVHLPDQHRVQCLRDHAVWRTEYVEMFRAWEWLCFAGTEAQADEALTALIERLIKGHNAAKAALAGTPLRPYDMTPYPAKDWPEIMDRARELLARQTQTHAERTH